MDYFIFNDSKYSVSPIEELNFLKTSLLFGNHIALVTPIADFINIYYAPENWTVEQKLKNYPEVLKTLEFSSDVKIVMDCFDMYLKLKKVKHKNKKQLVFYQMSINAIQSTDKFIKAGIVEMLVHYCFHELEVFITNNKNNIVFYVAGANNYDIPEQLTRAVELISKAIYVFNSLPVLSDLSLPENTNIFKIDGVNNIHFEESNNSVIELELFKVPRAQPLATSQIKQIREELLNVVSDFHEDLYVFNKTNCAKHFNSDTLESINEFAKNTLDKISDIQNTINNNIYLTQSRINYPMLEDVMITLNFTSNDILINIFKEMKLISDDAALYIKEMVTKFSDLSAVTTFLTFKNINHV